MKNKMLVLLLMLSLMASPVIAQDFEATPEPTVEVVDGPDVITVEDGGTVIINEDEPPAEEPPAAEPIDFTAYFVPFVIVVGMLALGIIYVAVQIYGINIKLGYRSLPEGIQYLGKLGLEALINRAATTPDPMDDEVLRKLAQELGYRIVSADGGRVILVSDDPATPNLTVERTGQPPRTSTGVNMDGMGNG